MTDETDRNSSLSSLGSISHGAGLFLFGRVIKKGIGFITNIILTRTLGASLYGVFSYLNVVFSLFYVFTQLGSDKSVLRYLPEFEDDPRTQNVMLSMAYFTSLIASIIVGAIVYYFAPVISELTLNEALFVDVLQIGALVLPFNTLANITYSSFKAIERMDYNVAISSIAKPILRLVFVGGAVLLGYSVIGATAGLIITGFIAFVLSLVLLRQRTNLGRFQRPSKAEAKRYYDFSLPLTFNQLGGILYKRTDILMVGIFLSGSAVGIYNIAVMLSGMLALPLRAFNQLFPPIASKLYQNGEINELESVYSTVTRWIFTISLFPGLAVLIYSQEILRIFGEEFPEGAVVLVLFTIAQLTNSLVGPSGFLLMMSNHQYLTMINQIAGGVLNVILNYVLITEYGFVGAAIATATVLASINIVRVVEVWYFEKIVPYNIKYIKPLFAGFISTVAMLLLTQLFSQYWLIIIGGTTGAVAFFGTLYLIGFETEDIDLIKELIAYKI